MHAVTSIPIVFHRRHAIKYRDELRTIKHAVKNRCNECMYDSIRILFFGSRGLFHLSIILLFPLNKNKILVAIVMERCRARQEKVCDTIMIK